MQSAILLTVKKRLVEPPVLTMQDIAGSWYAIHVNPTMDNTVAFYLNLNRFKYYLPWVFNPSGKYAHDDPSTMRIFPGYIFVKFDIISDRWQIINNLPGVMKLLPRNSERPMALPLYFVGQLRDDVRRGVFHKGMESEFIRKFVEGETVAVTSGPFEQSSGRFVRQVRGSVTLLMHFFGRPSEVTIPLHQVQ